MVSKNDLKIYMRTTQTADFSLGVSCPKPVDSQLPALRVSSGADAL